MQFGDPDNVTEVPRVTDLSISFAQDGKSTRAGQQFDVRLVVSNPNAVYGAKDVRILLVKPPSATWGTPYYCTPVGQNEMQCDIVDIRQASATSVDIPVVSDQAGNLHFSASVVSDTYDPNTDNNAAYDTKSIDPRSVDLGIQFDGYKEHEYAIVGESRTYEMKITQWGPDEARNAVLTMSIPANINITSANFSVVGSPGHNGSCSIGTDLVCMLGTVPHNGASYKATVDITVSGLSEGIVDQTASISSEGIESDPSDNQVSFTSFVGKTLMPIQAAIDSASPGDTVVIPDGLYAGTLSLVSGDIVITSANGRQSTSVWLTDPLRLGPSTSVRNITFLGRSYLSATNVANLEVSGNLFSGLTNAIEAHSVSGTIYDNRFTGGDFVALPGFSHCAQVRLGWYSSVRVYNNIFDNNTSASSNCGAVWIEGVVDKGQTIEITNNTFVGNDWAVMVEKPYDALTTIDVANNIMQSNDRAVTVTTFYSGTFEPSVFTNLTYENSTDYIGISPERLVGNLSGDPLMADPANGDFRLQAGSIAIDAATDASAPLSDFYGSSRPIDGDGDAISASDIGAHEFVPN